MSFDVSSKIRNLSIAVLVVGIIISIALVFYIGVITSSILLAFIVAVSGCLGSWAISIVLEGFAQLVQDTRALRYNVESIQEVYYKKDEK